MQKDPQRGQFLESSSLRALRGQCTNFEEEDTALQFLGNAFRLESSLYPQVSL